MPKEKLDDQIVPSYRLTSGTKAFS